MFTLIANAANMMLCFLMDSLTKSHDAKFLILQKRIIIDSNLMDPSRCIDLAVSLESVIHWLLTCMYSSLENLSDLSFPEKPNATDISGIGNEDSNIVTKCRNLISHLLSDTFISSLIHVAVLEDEGKLETTLMVFFTNPLP